MFKKLGITTSIITLYSLSAMALNPGLRGAEGTLANVNSAINQAVERASRLFEENQGKAMPADFSMMKESANPYLKTLRITKDYKVEIKFAGEGKKADSYTSPVAKGLLGADIVLIPVYNSDDEKITSWECVTNADRQVQEFMGDTAKEYSASYIREVTKSNYLSLCIYVNKDLVKSDTSNSSSSSSGNSSSNSSSNSSGNSSSNSNNSGNTNNGHGNDSDFNDDSNPGKKYN